ncbi:MAG: hypothetical protein HY321_10820 [Armatimonadetes bacterium]|nr:hypothetical protein [Armatimonadota bacterium]
MPVPDDPGAFYCERHKSVSTRVRCSRCGAPICPRCMVPAPVGIQCRKCASQRAPLRPRGVIHAAGRTISAGAAGAGRAVWYLSLWAFLISIVRGFFGGRDT